jgi:RNA polymerase sigma factor (TIGR02999 family)
MSPSFESTPGPVPGNITQLLNARDSTSAEAKERLAELVYGELRRIAGRIMASERPGHTLQATALATDAYLSLVQNHDVQWCDRFHFFAVASRAMRRVLVDHSRRKGSQKRGAGWERTDASEAVTLPMRETEELLALDQALDRLEQLDGRQCQIVELRYFGGLTEEEVAEVLDVSVRTVKREWSVARAWLFAELTRTTGSRPRSEGSWPR